MDKKKKIFIENLNRYGTDFSTLLEIEEFKEIGKEKLFEMYSAYLAEKSWDVKKQQNQSKLKLIEKIYKQNGKFKILAEREGNSQKVRIPIDISDYKLPFLLKDMEYYLKQQLTYLQEVYRILEKQGAIKKRFIFEPPFTISYDDLDTLKDDSNCSVHFESSIEFDSFASKDSIGQEKASKEAHREMQNFTASNTKIKPTEEKFGTQIKNLPADSSLSDMKEYLIKNIDKFKEEIKKCSIQNPNKIGKTTKSQNTTKSAQEIKKIHILNDSSDLEKHSSFSEPKIKSTFNQSVSDHNRSQIQQTISKIDVNTLKNDHNRSQIQQTISKTNKIDLSSYENDIIGTKNRSYDNQCSPRRYSINTRLSVSFKDGLMNDIIQDKSVFENHLNNKQNSISSGHNYIEKSTLEGSFIKEKQTNFIESASLNSVKSDETGNTAVISSYKNEIDSTSMINKPESLVSKNIDQVSKSSTEINKPENNVNKSVPINNKMASQDNLSNVTPQKKASEIKKYSSVITSDQNSRPKAIKKLQNESNSSTIKSQNRWQTLPIRICNEQNYSIKFSDIKKISDYIVSNRIGSTEKNNLTMKEIENAYLSVLEINEKDDCVSPSHANPNQISQADSFKHPSSPVKLSTNKQSDMKDQKMNQISPEKIQKTEPSNIKEIKNDSKPPLHQNTNHWKIEVSDPSQEKFVKELDPPVIGVKKIKSNPILERESIKYVEESNGNVREIQFNTIEKNKGESSRLEGEIEAISEFLKKSRY